MMNYNGFGDCFSEQGITIYLGDCMELLEQTPDKYYDLCVCDPPYGIGIGDNPFRQKHKRKDWDSSVPDGSYFAKLFRTCKNQIVWGGNYFALPPSQGFIIWDKVQPLDFSSAMCEFAWSSIQRPAKIFRKHVVSAEENKIHPTQKPVALYRWLLRNYAKPGDTIIDTHLGSGSSAIAAWEMGYTFTGIEIDREYFDAAVERIKKRMAQPYLPMAINNVVKAEQQPLFNSPHPTDR